MEAQPIYQGTGCLSNQLRKKVLLSVLTVCTDKEDLEETTTRFHETWFPQLLQLSIKNPILLPLKGNLLRDPSGNCPPHPPSSGKLVQTTSLDCLRENLHAGK